MSTTLVGEQNIGVNKKSMQSRRIVAQGPPNTTMDVDIVHRQTPDNINVLGVILDERNSKYHSDL